MGHGFVYFAIVKFELYAILALSLNLLVGTTGLVSLCHAAFYAVGAYSSALLAMRLGWPFIPATLGAVAVTMLLGALVAVPSLRLRDDYFIVATLAFQNIVYRVLYNADGLTRGALGLSDLPAARLFGITIPRESLAFVGLATVCFGIVLWILWRLQHSPFGRALRAVREDEAALAALGRNIAALKIKACLVAAGCAAVAGALWAVRSDVLHPDDFTIEQSVLMLTAMIVGGAGNIRGPLAGAGCLVLLEEGLRLAGGRWTSLAGEVNALVLAILLIVLLRLRPQGLLGEYRFE